VGSVDGTVVQARDIANLHLKVHEAVATLPTPRQLPPAPSQFVNRNAEFAQLDGLAASRVPVGGSRVVVLTGGHGVGKSATGSRWAHANSDRFVDGQLYADFGASRHRGGVGVSDVLAGFLRALGLGDEVIPAGLAERTALFRSRLAGKRLLVLLDDVEQAAQVKPLIPANSDCVVLVTTRAPLPELVFDGAGVVRLAPLDGPSADALLRRLVGKARVEAEPAAVVELSRICGGLPVALRICGAQLAGLHADRPVSWLVARLSDEERRLRTLSRGEGHSLQAVFDDAYRSLGPEQARSYRALGLHPGPTFSVVAAAAGIGSSLAEAEDLLEDLFSAHLIERGTSRFRFHDLLRAHARRTAEREEPASNRDEVVHNIVSHYVSTAQRMDLAIIPDRLRFAPPLAATEMEEPSFSSPAEGLAWFEIERPNLLAAIQVAHEREWDAEAWHLSEAMWIAYNNHKHFDEAREVYALGVHAAERAGDPDVQARMRQQLARAHIDLLDFAAAERELNLAQELASHGSNPRLQASIIEFMGLVHLGRGEPGDAVRTFRESLSAFAAIGYTRGVVLQEYLLGRALGASGRHGEAVAHLRNAELLVDRDADALTYGRILTRLGQALLDDEDLAGASESLVAAVDLMRRHDALFYVALALECLADVRARQGDMQGQRTELESALAVHEALGSARAEELSELLRQLPA